MLLSSEFEADKKRLEELMIETDAFQHRSPEEKPFQLASGIESSIYFDLKKLNGHPEGIKTVAKVFYHIIKEMKGVTSVGGLAAGSISIATAISHLSSYEHEQNPENPVISSFFVRDEAKEHGSKNQIEGIIESPVVVVDDVITSGDSAVKAVKAVKAMNDKKYECKCLISIVFRWNDEQEENIKKVSNFKYLFTEEYLVDKFTRGLETNQIA